MLYLTDMLTAKKLQALGFTLFEANAKTMRSMLEDEEWQSHIRKQSNADLLSRILDIKIDVNKEDVIIAELKKYDILVTFSIKRSKKQNKDNVIFYFVVIM